MPSHGVNIEVHDSKKRGKYYTYELMDTDGFGDKKISQNLKSRSYKLGTLYDAEDWDEDEHESKSKVNGPGSGPLEIVVPDDVTSVPHYRPSKNVRVRESYSDVDEQDNIDDLVLDKSEDKSSDILAMRLQQKAE